jgi:hypothetical protein
VGLSNEPAGFRPFLPHPAFLAYVPELDLPVDDGRYPYLRLIDPYDETVFSSHQCQVVEAEFERLAAERRDPEYSAALDLVRRCASNAGSSLWFVGD